ncbi:MAG: PAS domain S-box protein [Patescibacteria group bacterium]|jgi:PAS domain S-box-containing protein
MMKITRYNKQAAEILESITDAFLAVDKDWRVTYINRKAEKLLKKTRTNLLGKDFGEEFPGIKKTKFYTCAKKARETGKSRHVEAFVPSLNSWYEANFYPSGSSLTIYFKNITKRKLVSEDKETSLALLNTILSSASIGFALFDKNLRYKLVNKQLADINNLSESEHVGKTIGEVIPSLEKQVTRILKKVLNTGKPVLNFEVSGNTKQNPSETVYWRESFYPVKSTNGETIGVGVFVSDVTKQKHAEEKLKKREQEFSQLLQSTDQGIYGLDLRGRCTFVNKAACNQLGYVYRELVGKNMHQIVHGKTKTGEEYPEHKCPMYATFTTGKGVRSDDEILWRKDGNWFPVELSSYPIVEKEKTVGTVVTFTDITERKATEELIRRSEARFKALFNSNIIGVSIERIDGLILDANDAFLDTLGYTREDLEKGRISWIKATAPEYLEVTKEATNKIKTKGYSEPYEKEFIRKDGSRVPVLVGGAMTDEVKGEGISFLLDITEQKEAEKRKDEFIGMASHELKNPITTIKAYAQFLQRYLAEYEDPEVIDYLKKMDKQVDRLTNLISELLDVTRINSGKLPLSKKEFLIAEVINEAIESVKATAKKHTIINQSKVKGTVVADKDRISQVLINLLSNAVKYSPHGKKIIVKSYKRNGSITVAVQDFGIGIPKSKQQKIFNRFYRISSRQTKELSNLGLGLYISREIVRLHEGKIWVKSTENKGSTFYFSLPAAIEN